LLALFDLSTVSFLDLLPFIAVGFFAQLVDGALGMAFGVISATLLLSLGVAPAAASAGVHAVESFTTAASAASHVVHRNVDWRLFARLTIAGMIGGILGAYVLSNVVAETARPLVLAYLTVIGLYLFWRGLKYPPSAREPKMIVPLGLVGGFLDAAGGGGWGAVVTSNLLVQGASPRKAIGTVSAAEFFLTVTVSATFIVALGFEAFTIATVGLLIGGIAAAPLGAFVAKHMPARPLLIAVGIILTLTSAYGILSAIG
jgi:uncharacterized protein